jgi:hypothetical protein
MIRPVQQTPEECGARMEMKTVAESGRVNRGGYLKLRPPPPPRTTTPPAEPL